MNAQSRDQKNRSFSFIQNSKLKKNFIKKKLLYGYSKIHELKLVTIGIASPEKIQSWAEKELPNGKIFGEVTNANTFHYRTFKPSKGGLFCERIFGPIKDFECSCGKRQKPSALDSKKILEHEQTTRSFCPNCDVEYTWSIIRRYQLGYIKLNAPVAHQWFFKTNPSYLSILFDMKRKHLESIIYCTDPITIENTWKYSQQTYNLNRSPSDLYLTWQKFLSMEEQLKKTKIVSKNKKTADKEKKRIFRNRCFFEKKIHQHINWQTLEKERFFSDMKSLDFSKTEDFAALEKNDRVFLAPKTKKNILFNISKQKRKKFFIFFFEKSWKRILQQSYRNALFFMTSIDLFAEEFFQTTLNIFQMFSFLYEHKSTKEEKDKKNTFSILPTNTSFPLFSFLETFGNEIEKKRAWKSFFFLFDFVNFFLHAKKIKKTIKNSLSKSDILFLLHILPFLKKIVLFKTLKLQKESFTKVHSFLLQKTFRHKERTNRFENHSYSSSPNKVDSSFFRKPKSFYAKKWPGAQTEHVSKPIKTLLLSSHFSFFCFDVLKNLQKKQNKSPLFGSETAEKNDQKGFFWDSQILFKKNQKTYSLSFTQLSQTSTKFEKMLTFLKDAYKVEFCCIVPNLSSFSPSFFFSTAEKSVFMNKTLAEEKTKNELPVEQTAINGEETKKNSQKENFFFIKPSLSQEERDLSFDSLEVLLNQSETFCSLQKYSFEYFSFFLSFSGLLHGVSFESNCSSFFKLSKNSLFSTKKNIRFHEDQLNKIFYKKNFKTRKSLFSLLKYRSSFFLIFSKRDGVTTLFEEKTDENKNILFSLKKSDRQVLNLKNDQEKRNPPQQVFEKKFPPQKRKMQIYNKPLLSRMKFQHQKKQLQLDLLKKFFSFETAAEEFNTTFFKGRNLQHTSFDVQNSNNQSQSYSFPFSKKQQKKQGIPKFKTPCLLQMKINHQKNTEKNFLFSSFSSSNKSFQDKDFVQKFGKLKKGSNGDQSLKNIISTIAYNYSWSHDADWKYFLYYNSFFFYDFEDIPIFLYRSFSPFFNGGKAFMVSELNSSFSSPKKSFAPFLSWSMNGSTKNYFVGAGVLEKLLTEYNAFELRKMTKQHQVLLPKINQTLRFLKQNKKTKKDSIKIQKFFQKREHILRRLKFLRKFSRRNSNPTFMILRNLPVLPPDLRPILKLQNQIAASDLNRFYQRIIYRNDRLKKFSKDSATNQSFEIKYAQRLLQEAVDNLIQNGKGNVKAETNSRGQPLKSLSEILKGKQGRFRQYLLGKRVDYSGRSVIVVGPELKLYECGLPKEMAFELFLPFLIQYILKFKLAQTVVGAKNLLKADASFALHLLQKVMKNIPVLLNRAPTLHRLGFQAFLPKLIDGRAILLHPMVCPSFNADFDGDQMAVHIPLTVEARTESWKLMLSMNNLMNSATGESIILPSQDMVLGCFYLTLDFQAKFVGVELFKTFNKQTSFDLLSAKKRLLIAQNKSFLFFKNFTSILNSYQRGEITLHTPVWLKWKASVDFGNDFSKPLEIRLQINGCWEQIQPKYTNFYNKQNKILSKCIRTTPGRILMNFMIQECARGRE